MASSNKCSLIECKKQAQAHCYHCHSDVCSRHFNEHIQLINDQLIPLADQLNTICNTLQQTDVNRLCQQAFEQIEQWRTESHRSIDELCDQRHDAIRNFARQRIDQDAMANQILREDIKRLMGDGDGTYEQIEKIKKDIGETTARLKRMENVDSIDIKTTRLQIDPNSIIITSNSTCSDDDILFSRQHKVHLNEFLGKTDQQFELIYKATRDGFKAQDFHRLADNRGPTVVVFREKEHGYLFGGYTSIAWTSSGDYTIDTQAFLFTLTNAHNIPPTRYRLNLVMMSFAVFHNAKYGPTFGGGHDLYLSNDSQTTNNSSNFPHTFIDTTGKTFDTFAGSRNFQISEIEVYRLV